MDGKTIKYLLITIGEPDAPSSYYRIFQYLPVLKKQGMEFYWIKKGEVDRSTIKLASKVDGIFNQKSLLSLSKSQQLLKRGKHLIFDFDDAIFTRPGKPHSFFTRCRTFLRFYVWLKKTDEVITANQYLAKYANRFRSKVQILPMSLDLEKWKPINKPPSNQISIGWAGSPGNLPNIERIAHVLGAILKKRSDVRLCIFSGKKPNLKIPFEYYPYHKERQVQFCQSLDIGLLPLKDDEYSKGKSPIKAIQYLACGIPVVGNVIGATGEILQPDNSIAVRTEQEWFDALMLLIDNREIAKKLGTNGRRFVERRHDLKKNSEILWNILIKCRIGSNNGEPN